MRTAISGIVLILLLSHCNPGSGAEQPAKLQAAAQSPGLQLTSPLEYQVFQRDADNQGSMVIAGTAPREEALEYQISGANELPAAFKDWKPLRLNPTSHAFEVKRLVPAGGWYAISIRVAGGAGGTEIAPMNVITHFGIGEVFIVAGQSNSTNYGSEKQKVTSGFVSTFDGKSWRIADDPQPGVQDGSTGGSFIPAFGDELYAKLGVPIGVASVGCGATSVRQWLPKGDPITVHPTLDAFVKQTGNGKWACTGQLFDGMIRRMSELSPHGFRAVLWHQGESDAGQARSGYPADRQITGVQYTELMKRLISASPKEVGWDMPWMIAQATYHSPTDAADEEFRAAQRAVCDGKTIFQGPDTDALTDKFRAGVHFNPLGLQAHGKLWAKKVLADLHGQLPATPASR